MRPDLAPALPSRPLLRLPSRLTAARSPHPRPLDSTVLAYVLKLLNDRHDYGLNLVLLSVDEGISGYRDDSLETVKRNQQQYDLPLTIISYKVRQAPLLSFAAGAACIQGGSRVSRRAVPRRTFRRSCTAGRWTTWSAPWGGRTTAPTVACFAARRSTAARTC